MLLGLDKIKSFAFKHSVMLTGIPILFVACSARGPPKPSKPPVVIHFVLQTQIPLLSPRTALSAGAATWVHISKAYLLFLFLSQVLRVAALSSLMAADSSISWTLKSCAPYAPCMLAMKSYNWLHPIYIWFTCNRSNYIIKLIHSHCPKDNLS